MGGLVGVCVCACVPLGVGILCKVCTCPDIRAQEKIQQTSSAKLWNEEGCELGRGKGERGREHTKLGVERGSAGGHTLAKPRLAHGKREAKGG